MNKNFDIQQKNWKARKKNGKWIFLCSSLIFALGASSAMPDVVQQNSVVYAQETQGYGGDTLLYGNGRAEGKIADYVKTSYRVDGDYIYWEHLLGDDKGKNNAAGVYNFTIPNSVGRPERWRVEQIADGTTNVKGVREYWGNPDGKPGGL